MTLGVATRDFKHERFVDASNQIRLIRMLPRFPLPDRVSCEMKTVYLNEAEVYKALSYTWGERDSGQIVYIQSKPFKVRDNLYDFLSSTDCKAWLWIDQICIDQSDTHEREEQVSCMGEIYRRAYEVLVWLGVPVITPEDGTEACLKSLEPGDRSPWRGRPRETDHTQTDVQLLQVLSTTPYWFRQWIVQELWFAQRLSIRFGRYEIDPYKLRIFLDRISKFQGKVGHPVGRFTFVSTAREVLFNKSERDFESKPMGNTLRILGYFCKGKCSVPHDHIYALHALFEPGMQTAVPVDYGIDAQSLYIKVLSFLLDEALTNCRDKNDRQASDEWASLKIGAMFLMTSMFPEMQKDAISRALFASLGALRPRNGEDIPARDVWLVKKDTALSEVKQLLKRSIHQREVEASPRTVHAGADPLP